MRTVKSDLRRPASLEDKLKVCNELGFISLLSELGFRDEKPWDDSENELLGRLIDCAKKHTEMQMKIINSLK